MTAVTRSPYVVRNAAQIAEEQVFCYERRIAGMPVRTIASTWTSLHPERPMSHETVRLRCTRESAERVNPRQEEWKQASIERAESRLMRLHARLAVAPPLSDASLKIESLIRDAEDMLNRILGTYAAEKVDVTVAAPSSVDDELNRLAEKLGLNDPIKESTHG